MSHLSQHPICNPCAMRVVINTAVHVVQINGQDTSLCERCYETFRAEQSAVSHNQVAAEEKASAGAIPPVSVLPTARKILSRKRGGSHHPA